MRIRTRESLSNELRLTSIGNRPTNSGIIPYPIMSRDSTFSRSLSLCISSERSREGGGGGGEAVGVEMTALDADWSAPNPIT